MMDYVAGKIYKDPSLPGIDKESRKKVYAAMNKTIAKIHSVDVNVEDIADYGKHGKDILEHHTIAIIIAMQVDMLQDR